ncbi:MAG: hypothetical protein AAB628_00015 [Patescibacteria group bacterium]
MLENLRSKPDYIKKIIATFFATVVFIIIAFVWFSSYDARKHSEENRDKALSPLSGFTSMYDAKVFEYKSMLTGTPSYTSNSEHTATSTSTSTITFDISKIVIIDPGSSSRTMGTSSLPSVPTR